MLESLVDLLVASIDSSFTNKVKINKIDKHSTLWKYFSVFMERTLKALTQ